MGRKALRAALLDSSSFFENVPNADRESKVADVGALTVSLCVLQHVASFGDNANPILVTSSVR